MKTVILDTNFLVDCLAWKVDFFRELERVLPYKYELKVVDKTLDELDVITVQAKPEEKTGARIAKQLIARKRIEVIATDKQGHVDAIILKLASKDVVVATQDQEFKRKLKTKGIPVIIIRQKKFLELQDQKL